MRLRLLPLFIPAFCSAFVLLGAGGNVASMIILKFGEASAEEIKALMAAGLILFLLTLLVNMIADLIVNRSGRKGR